MCLPNWLENFVEIVGSRQTKGLSFIIGVDYILMAGDCRKFADWREIVLRTA